MSYGFGWRLASRTSGLRRPAWKVRPVSLLVSTASADAGTGVGPGPLTTGPLTGAPRWTEPAR